ncbi:MAG: RDD family protein [Bacteroidota bacterium]
MRSIEIRTTQNVTIEYELASLRERFFAFMIDLLIVMVVFLVIAIAMLSTIAGVIEESFAGGYVLFTLLPIALFILYQLFSEILADGQSWGKKVIGIKVVRLDGQEPGLSDYLLRAVFHLVDTIFSMGIVASLLVSSSAKSQRLGDLTANTTVIRIRFNLRFQLEDILKINTLDDYEPTYPDVRQLSEKDMLLIKTIISRYRRYPNEAHRKSVDDLVKRLSDILGVSDRPNNKIEFLKTLIRDYIVLTR